MAYDNTNFYGDLIVSEYDDKGNFMTPQTPTGYYVYHILGDGFDLMSEMCNQFMNDFSILTASPKSLDNFWGVSYNMPRPLLYEGQKADYLFVDNGTITSHNDNWDNLQYMTRTENGTIINNTGGGVLFERIVFNGMAYPFVNDDFTIEFEIVENNSSTIRFRIIGQTTCEGEQYAQLDTTFGNKETGRFKFVYDSTNNTVTRYKNGTYVNTRTHSFCGNISLQFRLESGASIKYKDFKVYTGEDKERYLTDDEYKIYLYLRNCRLMTREDIEINMNKCFAVENENSQYPIFFSTETNYLSVANHLNYNSKTTEESNLAKNDEDTSLNFITNFASDEDTLLIESGLSEVEEVIEVINVPSPNGYDPAFLELLENYISVKGNLKIKEYSI